MDIHIDMDARLATLPFCDNCVWLEDVADDRFGARLDAAGL
jgi:hypothetical protein